MPITSVIVETREGAVETVLGGLARFPHVSVYGVQGNRIVTVIEGKDAGEIEEMAGALAALDNVMGVFPVFAGYGYD